MEFLGIGLLGAPGWVELGLKGDPGEDVPRVLVKLAERNGRAVITRMVIDGDRLDSTTLRSVPTGRLEAILNNPKYGGPGGLFKQMEPGALADFAERGVLHPDQFAAIDKALAEFLERSPEYAPKPQVAPRKMVRQPLTRPDGTDPDGFSRRVAEAYNDALLSTHHPAPVLATEAHVPVTTVHRWIMEARRRGHLPPAHRGKAG